MSRRSNSRAPWLASWHGATAPPTSASSWLGTRNNWASYSTKGHFGEALTEAVFTRGFFDGTRYRSIAPFRAGGRGLDHLFLATDVIVAETKFGASRLGTTRDGRQLSESWTEARLSKTLERHGAALRSAVTRRPIRRVLVHVRRHPRLQLEVHELDSGSKSIVRVTNRLARQQLEQLLRLKMSPQEARRVSAEIVRDPRLLDSLEARAPRRWKIGLDAGLPIAITAGVTFDLALQLTAALSGETVRGRDIVHSALRTAVLSGTGYYVSRQAHTRLLLLSERFAGGATPASLSFGAGALAAVFISAGQWAVGMTDRKGALRSAASSIAGTGAGTLFTIGLTSAASTFGTAGTGTAIATLHGAAANSATLAWVGCGSAAAGAALATGGAFLAGIAMMKGVGWMLSERDERARGRLVRAHAQLLADKFRRLSDPG